MSQFRTLNTKPRGLYRDHRTRLYSVVIVVVVIKKLPIVVEGDPKAPFSIATTSRYKGGRYTFLWIAPLTFDSYPIMPSIKQGGIKYHFLSLWYDSTWDWTLVSCFYFLSFLFFFFLFCCFLSQLSRGIK